MSTEVMTRAEVYRMRSETLRNLQTCRRIAADIHASKNVRYAAIVMADEVAELLQDLEAALRLMPEV